MKLLVKTFKAGYGRTGEIWVENLGCSVCLELKVCLVMDSSEDEYGPGSICQDCINKSFQDAANYTIKTNCNGGINP